MQFPFITHGMVLYIYINDSIYRQNTNIEKMNVHASELRKFRYFYILKLLFLSIFCRYIRYFVGTNDMLVGLHVPTNFPRYRQISKCTDKSPKRHYWGGGAMPPSPPPSGYANSLARVGVYGGRQKNMENLQRYICHLDSPAGPP